MTEPSPSSVRLDRVTKRFGEVTAVDDLSLDIAPGEIVALLGPNGAGKTTTIDMVLGLARPTAGTVRVCGAEPRTAVSLGLVSAVLQTGGLLKDYTVRETVELTASLFAVPHRVGPVLERAGITDIGDRRVGACSGGQQQRLRFAMALLPDPELLILDEPTAGMDVGGRHEFWTSVREDSRRGRTVIFATHYLEEADAYADRVVFVRRGRVVADGTAAQVKALASGRVLRATVPEADRAGLADLPGVEGVELRGDSVVIRSRDTDAVARHLLTRTGATDLEITSHNLEEEFLALTADEDPDRQAPGGPAGRDDAGHDKDGRGDAERGDGGRGDGDGRAGSGTGGHAGDGGRHAGSAQVDGRQASGREVRA